MIEHSEALLAEVTDIAYQAVLRQGLQRSFVDVQLELWHEIRQGFRRREYEFANAPASENGPR